MFQYLQILLQNTDGKSTQLGFRTTLVQLSHRVRAEFHSTLHGVHVFVKRLAQISHALWSKLILNSCFPFPLFALWQLARKALTNLAKRNRSTKDPSNIHTAPPTNMSDERCSCPSHGQCSQNSLRFPLLIPPCLCCRTPHNYPESRTYALQR